MYTAQIVILLVGIFVISNYLLTVTCISLSQIK